MIYTCHRYVVLNSMGLELDNILNNGIQKYNHTIANGDIVFDPSSGTICTYSVNSGTVEVVASRPAVDAELYLNLITQKVYLWYNNMMQEADMTSLEPENLFPQQNASFSTVGIYHIKTVIGDLEGNGSNMVVNIASGSTLVFHSGGLFSHCNLIGNDIRIIPNGEQVIFSHCGFANCTFRDSQVFATNFGAVPDMCATSENWRYKDLQPQTRYVRSGTDNTNSFQCIGDFLSNSRNVHLTFNGEFYSSFSEIRFVTIRSAEWLEISGSNHDSNATLIFGIKLIDCLGVVMHHLRFVGHDKLHDFPTIFASRDEYISGYLALDDTASDEVKQATWDYLRSIKPLIQDYPTYDDFIESNYYLPYDGIQDLGLADAAIIVTAETKNCGDIEIHHCHIEMRQDGILAKSSLTGEYKSVSDVHIHDCSFDHIYYQAIESYCENLLAERVTANYCMQGVDISTGASNTTIRDSCFNHCATGSKQACQEGFEKYSHHNRIERCTFEIDDTMLMLNTSHFIFRTEQGRYGDTFVIQDSSFFIRSAFVTSGVICRSWRTLFDRVSFNLQTLRSDPSHSDMQYFASLGSSLRREQQPDSNSISITSPILEFRNCKIELNCSVFNLVMPNTSIDRPTVVADQLVVLGKLNGEIRQTMFYRCERLMLNRCSFFVDINSSLIFDCNFVQMTSCVANSISRYFIEMPDDPASSAIPVCNVEIQNCSLNVEEALLNLKYSGGSFCFRENMIRVGKIIRRSTGGNTAEVLGVDMIGLYSSTIYLTADTSLINSLRNDNELNEWNHLDLQNNTFHSLLPITIVSSTLLPENFAHIFYNNFLCLPISPVNEGSINHRPQNPWLGMVYYDGTYYYWDGERWENWALPDE
jgi:hypothetical protein